MAATCYQCKKRIYGKRSVHKCSVCNHTYSMHFKCTKDVVVFKCDICSDITKTQCQIVLTRIDDIAETLQLQPQDLNEDSFDATEDFHTNNNHNQSFEIIRGGSKKGKDILLYNGFAFNEIKKMTNDSMPEEVVVDFEISG
ncbi:DgyrCDS14502 [Dimorphilus gyrociliatus]|uniref:DgyrCDS14502 n=1 Tax=Dimorphilus gyrociliatus TaxID=2664684 RepID=A0A7I8WDU6_9ANNE|nr:DgyrCDS14502 [Dimorphilus gyrociliatus]